MNGGGIVLCAVGENGKLAKRILDEYMQGFIKRNHTLHVFSAHLHMDEALYSRNRSLEEKFNLKLEVFEEAIEFFIIPKTFAR